jgi:hypothetical protein
MQHRFCRYEASGLAAHTERASAALRWGAARTSISLSCHLLYLDAAGPAFLGLLHFKMQNAVLELRLNLRGVNRAWKRE